MSSHPVAHTLHTRLDGIEVTQHADGTGIMTFETSTSYARICARIPSGWSIVAWPNTQGDWVNVEIAARGLVVKAPTPAPVDAPIDFDDVGAKASSHEDRRRAAKAAT